MVWLGLYDFIFGGFGIYDSSSMLPVEHEGHMVVGETRLEPNVFMSTPVYYRGHKEKLQPIFLCIMGMGSYQGIC